MFRGAVAPNAGGSYQLGECRKCETSRLSGVAASRSHSATETGASAIDSQSSSDGDLLAEHSTQNGSASDRFQLTDGERTVKSVAGAPVL